MTEKSEPNLTRWITISARDLSNNGAIEIITQEDIGGGDSSAVKVREDALYFKDSVS